MRLPPTSTVKVAAARVLAVALAGSTTLGWASAQTASGWSTRMNATSFAPSNSVLVPPAPRQVHSRRGPLQEARTTIAALAAAPFPYDGINPATQAPFLDVVDGERRGHRTGSGRVLWADETFADNGVLLHLPQGFDARRPAVMVVYFHGHGASIGDDVARRQQLPAQVSASRANAVLVAPQLAVNAADSSPGKLWQPGGFARLLDEAARHLAKLHGDPRTVRTFTEMPVVIVAYSGGYVAAAWSLHHGGADGRIAGVVLLDAVYGELDKFTDWLTLDRKSFLVSAYTSSTRRGNDHLMSKLTEQHLDHVATLAPRLQPGTLAFLQAASGTTHRDFVTHAWTESPVADLLARLPVYRRR